MAVVVGGGGGGVVVITVVWCDTLFFCLEFNFHPERWCRSCSGRDSHVGRMGRGEGEGGAGVVVHHICVMRHVDIRGWSSIHTPSVACCAC